MVKTVRRIAMASRAPHPPLTPNTLTKNTSTITIALSIQKVIAFAYFAYIAQHVGDDNVGKYTYALSITAIFGIFIDFGLGPLLTREIAKHTERVRELLSRIVALKLILAVFFVLLIFPAVSVLDSIREIPGDTKLFIWIGIAIMLLDSATFTFYSVLRGLRQLTYESYGILLYQVIIVTVGAISVFFGRPVLYVVLAILAGSLFNFLYSLSLLLFRLREAPVPRWEFSTMPKTLRIAAPFAIAGIFFKLSGTIDVVMLGTLADYDYVGWYTTASKLMLALTVLPGGLATAYFPAISQKLLESREEARKMFEMAVRYLMILALPITAGVLVIAEPLVVDVFSKDFEASAEALSIMILGLVFLFVNYPVGNLLNAANRQLLNTMNMGIALALNAGLNLWLIPERTFIGASISTLVSMIVLALLGLPWAKKIVDFRVTYLLREFLRITLVSALMGILLFELRDSIHYANLILIGIVFYLPSLLVFGVVKMDEARFLLTAVCKRFFRSRNEKDAVHHS